MTKSDDSSLDPDDLRTVEERARQLLDRADAWDRYPVPTNDILAAAKVQVAPGVCVCGRAQGRARTNDEIMQA